jgi:hypothetical protein
MDEHQLDGAHAANVKREWMEQKLWEITGATEGADKGE